jgi:diguanylate cyclase (GGDEF)-like protein/PAS domain S-box-containing protein
MNENPAIRYDQLVENLPIGVYQLRATPDGKVTVEYVNRHLAKMLRVSTDALYQDPNLVFRHIHPDERESFARHIWAATREKRSFTWEGRVAIEGETRWVRIAAFPLQSENGDVIWSGAQIDITEQKHGEDALREANALLVNRLAEIEKLQAQLREHAVRDYLTGLFNRRYLDETMERELARSRRETRKLSVVMIDIDRFKGINDIYGHQAGDDVLIALGKLLTEYSRASDIACRYGGDEFAVVMLNASVKAAHKRAEEWRLAFAKQQFEVNGEQFSTTLSMGIATYPLHGSSPRGIFQAADEALYHSKKYKNRVTVSRRIATGRLGSLD